MHLLDNATNDDDDDNDMQHGPPSPSHRLDTPYPNRTQPQSNPDHGTCLGLWRRGELERGVARGRDRQANKQPSDIYQQPPSSAGYIRAFARLSLLTALYVSGDMAQWGRSK